MQLVDYTHPQNVPALHIRNDRRSSDYYLKLHELPYGHPLYSRDWILFRYPEWLLGATAWIQAKAIAKDLDKVKAESTDGESIFQPVVGSGDPVYDDAVSQCLYLLGYRPKVAAVVSMPMPSATANAVLTISKNDAS